MIASDLRTVFVRPSAAIPKQTTADLNELRKTLETGSDSARISAMKSLILSLVNGEKDLAEALLMTLIRFILPLRNKTLKKLLLYLFENIPKTDSEGNLKQEFILVCNAWRNDLQHPNEYIRGATLRFLVYIREPELLEPLVPSIRQCLEHEHVYVRRNAIYATFSVFKHVEFLMPDAPELIEGLLTRESDVSCQRAAFIMLSETEPHRATNYFNLIADKLPELDGNLQLAVIEFIQRDCQADPKNREKLIKTMLALMKRSSSPAARFESASALMTMVSDEETLKACCVTLIQLAIKEADNSIKLVVLMKLKDQVLPNHPTIIQACVLDLLRVLSSSDISVRKLCLELVSAGTSSRVALEIVQFLKKELVGKSESDSTYRRELLDTLHVCAIKFSEVATEVMNSYLDLLKNGYASETLISFIKELLFKYPSLRQGYLSSVVAALPSVTDSKAVRNLLWVLGEFCQSEESCLTAIKSMALGLGDLPMLAVEEAYEAAQKQANTDDPSDAQAKARKTLSPPSRPKVLADGTYASESAFSMAADEGSSANADSRTLPNIKKLFLDGKFECSGVFANAVTKLIIRLRALKSAHFEATRAQALLMLTSTLRLGASKFVAVPIDNDSAERIALCIQLILDEDAGLARAFTSESEAAFNVVLQQESKHTARAVSSGRVSVDEVVDFGFAVQADKKTTLSATPNDSLDRLLYGSTSTSSASSPSASSTGPASLNKVVQLTGFSDSIYAETYVQVRDKEIYLDILLVNQTEDTLQSVSLDFNCAGDLKLVERPPVQTLSPLSFATAKAVFRVTATNHGQIFGCISFLSGPSGQDADSVILAEVKIDVLEYIQPASLPESRFRETWVLLEWENKISVRVPGEYVRRKWPQSALRQFINFLTSAGHISCITPNAGLEGSASFSACNFYAKSIFDEEILANICLEQSGDTGAITGHLRLRSKTQGLAISFGDKLNSLIQQLK